jgi:predicted ribosomally synthesized peptide with nif11-like leader
MSRENAQLWINYIHENQELGERLVAINNWDNYFDIVHSEGYDFTQDELNEAWEVQFGSDEISINDLENISGGADTYEVNQPITVMGVRG